jgi:hypothetical protein
VSNDEGKKTGQLEAAKALITGLLGDGKEHEAAELEAADRRAEPPHERARGPLVRLPVKENGTE